MPLKKTLQELVATGKAVYRDDVKAFFGTDEDWSLHFDSSAGEWKLTDESASTDAIRIPNGNTLSGVLENGGVHEINVGSLSGQLADPQTVSVEEGGTAINDFDTLNFTTNLNVTDAGSGQADVDAADAGSAMTTSGQIIASLGG